MAGSPRRAGPSLSVPCEPLSEDPSLALPLLGPGARQIRRRTDPSQNRLHPRELLLEHHPCGAGKPLLAQQQSPHRRRPAPRRDGDAEVMQALGQRVGSQRAMSGAIGRARWLRFRQSAVEGSKKQSARMPDMQRAGEACEKRAQPGAIGDHCRERAELVGGGIERAGDPWTGWTGWSGPRRGARRNRRGYRRAGRGRVAPRPRRGILTCWSRHSPRRRRPRRACTGSCRRWCRTAGWRCARRWCAGTGAW